MWIRPVNGSKSKIERCQFSTLPRPDKSSVLDVFMPNRYDLCVLGVKAITKFNWTSSLDKLRKQTEEDVIQLPAVMVHDVTQTNDYNEYDRLMIGCNDGSISIFHSSDPEHKMTFYAIKENGQPRYGRAVYVKLQDLAYNSEFQICSHPF